MEKVAMIEYSIEYKFVCSSICRYDSVKICF